MGESKLVVQTKAAAAFFDDGGRDERRGWMPSNTALA